MRSESLLLPAFAAAVLACGARDLEEASAKTQDVRAVVLPTAALASDETLVRADGRVDVLADGAPEDLGPAPECGLSPHAAPEPGYEVANPPSPAR